MIEKITPDKNKAVALFKMSDELFERVKKYSLESFPSPNLSDLYDVIHMRLEGLLLLRGIKCKGESAHFELILESKKQKILTESEENLVQKIRDIRNRYKYEGYAVTPDFISRNEQRILKIIEKLQKLTKHL